MNILTINSADNDIVGISTALAALKENITWWNPEQKSPYDAILEKKPDFIIAEQNALSNELVQAIEHFKVKVIFKSKIIPPQISDLVYKLDIQQAANIAQFNKGINVYKYNIPIFHYSTKVTKDVIDKLKLVTKIGLRICGPVRLPIPQYLGHCSLKTTINLISSCSLYLDFDLQTAYNVGSLRILPLTNIPNDIFPYYNNENEYLEKINLYLTEEKLRKKLAKNIYKIIYDNHTYFHRLSDIGKDLDIQSWKENSLDMIKRLRT